MAQGKLPPGIGDYHGCSDPTEEGLDIARAVVGEWDANGFDFRTLPYARPITADVGAAQHALCDEIRAEAPPEHDYERLSFFDAGAYYLAVSHPSDPDPADDFLSMGLRTVGVYDRSGRYVAAVSF